MVSRTKPHMTRYAITVAVPKIGDAQSRAMAAHPGSVIIAAERMKGGEE